MLKGKEKIELPKDIDPAIYDLINMINNVPGIETVESCCGHNHTPCQIWCVADSMTDLNKFWYKYFYCDHLWHFKFYLTDRAIDDDDWDRPHFVIESDPRYVEYPVPNVMISELTKRFKIIQDEDVYKEDKKELVEE